MKKRELTRREFIQGVAAASGVALGAGALAACTPASTSPSASAAATASAAASAAPRRGGTVAGADVADPPGLDPHKVPQLAGATVYTCMYSPLCVFDSKLAVKPHVAESWDVSTDGKTYTFKIRSGVKFHNGRELTSEDVRYSLERVRDPKLASTFASDLAMVDQIVATDPRTLRVTLKFPTALFLKNMAQGRASQMVAKEVVEQSGDLQKVDGGSGPWKLTNFESNNFYALERFDQYFDPNLPYVDGVRWRVLPDAPIRQAALRTGQLDWSAFAQVEAEQMANDSKIVVKKYADGGMNHIWINFTHKPLDDPRVRQALNISIDRNEIIAKAYGAAELSGPVPSGHPTGYGMTKDELPAYYAKPQIDQARKLLADAGFAGGFKTSISIIPSGYPEMPLTAQILQQQWKQIGVDLQLRTYAPGAALGQDYNAGNWDMLEDLFIFGPDADNYIYRWFHSTGSTAGGVKPLVDAQTDALLDKGRQQAEGPERRQTYLTAQQRLLETVPNIWLHTRTSYEALSARLQGYEPQVAGRGPSLGLIRSWLTT